MFTFFFATIWFDKHRSSCFTYPFRECFSSHELALLVQVVLGWYFGDSEPKKEPKPILVGGHMGHHYQECNFRRALIDAVPIQVTLPESAVKDSPARFGTAKCRTGDEPGRWIFMNSDACAPPYCTGDRKQVLNTMDWVCVCYHHLLDFLVVVSLVCES